MNTALFFITHKGIAHKHAATLISGVNLPIIIRLLNYRDESEQTLIKKALDGAIESIQKYKTKH